MLSESFLSVFFRDHRERPLCILYDPSWIQEDLLRQVFPQATLHASTSFTSESENNIDLFFYQSLSLAMMDFTLAQAQCGWAESVEEEPEGRMVHRWPMGIFLIRSSSLNPFLPKVRTTLITPSIRPEKIQRIYASLSPYLDYIDAWKIVYDGKKIKENPHQLQGQSAKIQESVHRDPMSISGNAQRNYALRELEKEGYQGHVYYVDDDNLIHPNLYLILHLAEPSFIYTFDSGHLKGRQAIPGRIDTAMALIPFPLCRKIRWELQDPMADGTYIATCCRRFSKKWVYLKIQGAGYNMIR